MVTTASSGKQGNEPRGIVGKNTRNMVRISAQTHSVLHQLSRETGEPMQDLIAEAVEAMRRKRILEMTNEAYAAMRADPARWQEELEERGEWDVTLADGQKDE